jgi:hypothetical protein
MSMGRSGPNSHAFVDYDTSQPFFCEFCLQKGGVLCKCEGTRRHRTHKIACGIVCHRKNCRNQVNVPCFTQNKQGEDMDYLEVSV